MSFYLALVGLCAKSLNAVENFRYTTRGGEVCLLERRDIAFCSLPDGADQFHMTCMEYKDGFDLKTFCREAREKSRRFVAGLHLTLSPPAQLRQAPS